MLIAAIGIVLTLVFTAPASVESASAPKTDLSKSEQILAEMMALPAKERLQKLVEGAKKKRR